MSPGPHAEAQVHARQQGRPVASAARHLRRPAPHGGASSRRPRSPSKLYPHKAEPDRAGTTRTLSCIPDTILYVVHYPMFRFTIQRFVRGTHLNPGSLGRRGRRPNVWGCRGSCGTAVLGLRSRGNFPRTARGGRAGAPAPRASCCPGAPGCEAWLGRGCPPPAWRPPPAPAPAACAGGGGACVLLQSLRNPWSARRQVQRSMRQRRWSFQSPQRYLQRLHASTPPSLHILPCSCRFALRLRQRTE